MIGSSEWFGVATPSSRRRRTTRALCFQMTARSASPRCSLTSNPLRTVASDATGEGPEYRYGGAATLSSSLTSVGQAMNASSDEYAFENPLTRIRLS